MPRRTGLEQSTYFHVWNRGADRQDIFFDPRDQELFEGMMADAIERSGARVHAYSLMTNHFHMIVEAEGTQLSDLMYWLGRSYAVWLNAVAGRTGPVFDGRFGSQPITDSTMLMVEGRYVHRNPADITGLDSLANYRFSSLGVYAGLRPNPGWLVTEVLAEPFADGTAHLGYVRRTLASDAQFCGRRPPLTSVGLDQLDEAVCSVTRVGLLHLRSSTSSARNDANRRRHARRRAPARFEQRARCPLWLLVRARRSQCRRSRQATCRPRTILRWSPPSSARSSVGISEPCTCCVSGSHTGRP